MKPPETCTGGSSQAQPHPYPSITRVTLSNGYRAYRPSEAAGTTKPARPKTVRFVKGHDSESMVESVALTEAGSEDSEDELEYDFLRDIDFSHMDFLHDEADGWVPVMVAEEEEGDDWMSLTGSWVLMGGALAGEAKK
ncbi:hypothetical protein C8A00DRAFT_13346 [Chaetomidium leptoderma]|uniref:Uncharacterized protein n=1 Tax=Chaetomidium leptoderma TaxID=669021 RepID=A0AAN6VPV4_9PEZI|nr:hypothetical protein C8A00DRAFT_13346 [Chaetomidium leptoderma]